MDKRIEVANILKTKNPKTLKAIIGFDGFIDEIIHVVDKRQDFNHFERIETMDQLADRIDKASGLSTNIELVTKMKKMGGNGPIMANALKQHEVSLTVIGSLGDKQVEEVFEPLCEGATCYSVSEPGKTDALEFNDGKVMLGKMVQLKNVNYDNIIKKVGFDQFVKLIDESNLLGMTNWSMLPMLTDIWSSVYEHIVPHIIPSKKRFMFVDLTDFEKRENSDVLKAIQVLKQFNTHFTTVLGLNKKEAYDMAMVLELFDRGSLEEMQVSLEDLNLALSEALQLDYIVIHPVDRSCVVHKGVFYTEKGPYIKKPKLSTGAGDNFNAGFMFGLLLGLSPDQALLSAMGTSGFYVRNARSPKFDELIQFLEDFANDKINK